MPKRLFKPPSHMISDWPEVFSDLYMNTMPVAYLDMIKFEFKDGRVWELNIQELIQRISVSDVAEKLLNTVSEYRHEIKNIDFKLDVDRLKKDIENKTKDIFN